MYTQTCAGSTETLQGEGEEKFSPSYQSLSQFQLQEGIRGIAPPPPAKDRISVFYRVMPWLFVKFLWQFAKSTYQHFGVERDTL